MRAEHGALADTREYFPSIQSLLLSDQPGELLAEAPVSRGADDDRIEYDAGPPIYPTENELELELIGKRRRRSARVRELPTIRVRVRAGDLRDCTKPIMVGHYEQDPITGAEALVDRAIVGGALSMRHNLGLYAGPIGSATVVLTARNEDELRRGNYHGAVVAGLGKLDGTLSVNGLTEAVRSAAIRYLLHIYDASKGLEGAQVAGVSLVSLLLGYNSSASLSIADSIGAMVRGVIDANRRFNESFKSRLVIEDLEIVELYIDTAISAGYALTKVAKALNADPTTGYRIEAATEIVASDSMLSRLEDSRGTSYWPRFHITDFNRKEAAGAAVLDQRAGDKVEQLKFLFVGARARAETVVQQRQPGLVDKLVAQQVLVRSYNEDFSRTLFQLLIPNEFKDAARQLDRVVLVLDGYSANIPWELMLADKKPLAVSTALVRQLSSTTFRSRVRQATEPRAYVIGNPKTDDLERAFPSLASGKKLPSLVSAEREAETVARVLGGSRFNVTRAIGDSQSAIDIINGLYRHPYRILHIAAHGLFDEMHADGTTRTGVVLSGGLLITAAEVCAMEVVPEIVFLNCCHLAQTNTPTSTQYNRLAYSLSRELIEMGVRAVVAAGWAVEDDAAALFAETFYDALVTRNVPFGDAVFEARRKVYDLFPSSITWGAYQAYGDPMWRIDPRTPAGTSERASSDDASLAAPEELIAKLEQLRVNLRRMTNALTTAEANEIAQKAETLMRGRPESWSQRLDVQAALGALYGDMGPDFFGKAVEHLRRAVTLHDKPGRAPVAALEMLANLEARAGEQSDDEAMILASIRRLDDLARFVTRSQGGDPDTISPELLNPERRGLLGSAYKRLAAVHARRALRTTSTTVRATALRKMDDALARSRYWYGGPILPLQQERERGKSDGIHLYTTSNRLFLEALERAEDRSAAIELARECRRLAVDTGTLDANYWNSTTKADALLAEALLDQSLLGESRQRQVQKITRQYRDARHGVLVGPRALDSTVQQVSMMALFLEARATKRGLPALDRKALTIMAESLRLVEQALGGADVEEATNDTESTTPQPAPTTRAARKVRTAPARPKRAAKRGAKRGAKAKGTRAPKRS